MKSNLVAKMGWKDKLAKALEPFKGCKTAEEIVNKAKQLNQQQPASESMLNEGVVDVMKNVSNFIWGGGAFATVISMITIGVTQGAEGATSAAIISGGVFAAGLVLYLMSSILGWVTDK